MKGRKKLTNKDRMRLIDRRSNRIGENNDCAVRAVSLTTGVSYYKVHEAFRTTGRKKGRGTPRWMTFAVLNKLGFSVRRVAERHPMRKGKTIVTMAKLAPSRGAFLVAVRDHILAVKGGEVLDWTKGRRHRPVEIWRVSKKKTNDLWSSN